MNKGIKVSGNKDESLKDSNNHRNNLSKHPKNRSTSSNISAKKAAVA